jgi:hypothetical protein
MSVSAWHPHCFAVLDMNRNTGSVKDRSKTQTPALPLYEVVYADNSPQPGSSIAARGRATTEPLVNPAFGPMTKWLGTSKSESCRGASRLTRRRSDLAMVARDESILLVCSHIDRAMAQNMVECLQRYRVDYARVVEGVCGECDGRKG